MGLLGLLRVDADAAVRVRRDRLRLVGLGVLQVTEQLLRPLEQAVTDTARDAEHHPRRLVPAAEVAHERVPRSVADRLLAADDVPAERLIAPEELLVDAADEVA